MAAQARDVNIFIWSSRKSVGHETNDRVMVHGDGTRADGRRSGCRAHISKMLGPRDRRPVGVAESSTLLTRESIASCYGKLGDTDKEIAMKLDLLPTMESQLGDKHPDTLQLVHNLSRALGTKARFSEAKRILAKSVPAARSTYGDEHECTLKLRSQYCTALFAAPGSTLGDQKEAESTLKEIAPVAQRVLGPIHPTTRDVANTLSLISRSRKRGDGKLRIVVEGTT